MAYTDILHQVSKPARYTGGEWNSLVKDWDKTAVRMALSYPDIYEIGMSNIALPILYNLLNRQADVLAERVYAPWTDMAAEMQAKGIPLGSLESKRPLKDFDIIGFSLGYELTYTNVLNLLDLAQIPVLAAERDDSYPVIIAGGSSALNPEPMADFIDIFVIGEGEEVLLELVDGFRNGKGAGKEQLFRQVAQIPGVYVPSLYQVEYQADGLLKQAAAKAANGTEVYAKRVAFVRSGFEIMNVLARTVPIMARVRQSKGKDIEAGKQAMANWETVKRLCREAHPFVVRLEHHGLRLPRNYFGPPSEEYRKAAGLK